MDFKELKSEILDYLKIEGVVENMLFSWFVLGVFTVISILGSFLNGGSMNDLYAYLLPMIVFLIVIVCAFQFAGFLAFIHAKDISFCRLCFSCMTSWCWKLRINFRAVSLTEVHPQADGGYYQKDHVHSYEDTLTFVSRFTLERYLEKHQDIQVLKRCNNQRLVIARDRYVRGY